MKRAIASTVALMAVILMTGCDGDHPNSIIVCWQEQSSGGISTPIGGGSAGGTTWECVATYVGDNGAIHDHNVGDDYVGRYKGCQARGQNLTADVTTSTERHGRAGTRTSVNVGQTYCSDPPSSGGSDGGG